MRRSWIGRSGHGNMSLPSRCRTVDVAIDGKDVKAWWGRLLQTILVAFCPENCIEAIIKLCSRLDFRLMDRTEPKIILESTRYRGNSNNNSIMVEIEDIVLAFTQSTWLLV